MDAGDCETKLAAAYQFHQNEWYLPVGLNILDCDQPVLGKSECSFYVRQSHLMLSIIATLSSQRPF